MSKPKVNFIIPSWGYWKEPTRAQPLTQLYLATILQHEGVDVNITDLRDGPKPIDNTDLFFYTVASPDVAETRQIVKTLKDVYPESKHVAGGPHPSIRPNETQGFDSVVVGKGEEAVKQIIEDFPNLKSSYQMPANGTYPFPRRHFLPKDKIVNDNLFKTDNMPSTTAQFSFGCPFECSFCANYTRGPVRRNSLDKIGTEIDYLKSEYGIQGLSLQDEIAIPLHPERAKEFLDLIKSKDISWRGQIRALKDTRILERAKESGLVELSFGLESVNQDVLDLTGKKIQIADVKETLDACEMYGIKTRLYLLNGLPGEPEDIVDQTKAFVTRYQPDLVLLSSLQPYPGSPIADHPEKFGMKSVSTDYDRFNHLMCRFSDSDDNPENAVPYQFEEGRGLSRKQIIANLLELQEFLREGDKNK